MTKRDEGPKPVGDTLTTALERLGNTIREKNRKHVEASARPGETYEQAEVRLRHEQDQRDRARLVVPAGSVKSAPPPTIRKPPKGDEQPDFFVPALYDVGTRDSRSMMDVAVFRLSKKEKRAGEVIRYNLPDGYV